MGSALTENESDYDSDSSASIDSQSLKVDDSGKDLTKHKSESKSNVSNPESDCEASSDETDTLDSDSTVSSDSESDNNSESNSDNEKDEVSQVFQKIVDDYRSGLMIDRFQLIAYQYKFTKKQNRKLALLDKKYANGDFDPKQKSSCEENDSMYHYEEDRGENDGDEEVEESEEEEEDEEDEDDEEYSEEDDEEYSDEDDIPDCVESSKDTAKTSEEEVVPQTTNKPETDPVQISQAEILMVMFIVWVYLFLIKIILMAINIILTAINMVPNVYNVEDKQGDIERDQTQIQLPLSKRIKQESETESEDEDATHRYVPPSIPVNTDKASPKCDICETEKMIRQLFKKWSF